MTGNLVFDVCRRNGLVTLAVRGEVDLDTAPELADCLASLGDTDIDVDLAAVGFLDSSGLAVLASAYSRLHESGHRLRTVHEPEIVRRVLEVSGLYQLFHP